MKKIKQLIRRLDQVAPNYSIPQKYTSFSKKTVFGGALTVTGYLLIPLAAVFIIYLYNDCITATNEIPYRNNITYNFADKGQQYIDLKFYYRQKTGENTYLSIQQSKEIIDLQAFLRQDYNFYNNNSKFSEQFNFKFTEINCEKQQDTGCFRIQDQAVKTEFFEGGVFEQSLVFMIFYDQSVQYNSSLNLTLDDIYFEISYHYQEIILDNPTEKQFLNRQEVITYQRLEEIRSMISLTNHLAMTCKFQVSQIKIHSGIFMTSVNSSQQILIKKELDSFFIPQNVYKQHNQQDFDTLILNFAIRLNYIQQSIDVICPTFLQAFIQMFIVLKLLSMLVLIYQCFKKKQYLKEVFIENSLAQKQLEPQNQQQSVQQQQISSQNSNKSKSFEGIKFFKFLLQLYYDQQEKEQQLEVEMNSSIKFQHSIYSQNQLNDINDGPKSSQKPLLEIKNNSVQ